ncbi:lysylphosphatidylglycerol synthase domain-containing protein [Pseudobutyrivibrio xylanivorans]|uniref:Phosphatidylglycerol lysyltransferase n=1 Tax=Pseudobutyrivibrio xylanivorans DSM 14809 TaxID=1123012 RepID=A0A1M6JQP4_PSEXY|nr:lysylphosphatidylglycerol synthase domain-containing protein [Pseudobutyrivibrio xylanivorans]SHJ49014.1 Lysylphosphatidylglycerol synthase TM region [Pseudobutyrivibrio xylanivorans DSM 14809]
MKKKSLVYNWINILVLFAAALIFFLNYNIYNVFQGVQMMHIVVVVATVVMVHFLKALRLYLALYGADITPSAYAKTYCKVTPVSILIPFKLGEFFRMYCYGHQAGNMLKGIVTVLMDRFMDTIALVTMIVVMWLASGETIIPLVYLLVVFLVIVTLMIIVFPGLYSYWKKYLLRADGTVRKIKMLRFLDTMNRVYLEIMNVSKGRGIILYVLSLLAWAVEIGSVVLLNAITVDGAGLSNKISEYLKSALVGSQTIELKRFVLISVILMIVIYLLVKAIDISKSERK